MGGMRSMNWAGAAVSLLLVPSVLAAEDRCGFAQTIERHGYRVEVAVADDEACSVGTYALVITPPKGKAQRLTEERDGTVQRVWLEDLSGDGRPEIIVQTASAGSGSYGAVALYADRNHQFRRRRVAPLTGPQRKGYMGHDQFEVTGGVLFRSFPLYKGADRNAQPTGGMTRLKYSYQRNRWETP